MSEHTHKFNATIINKRGKCSCGAWGKYVDKAWVLVTHEPTAKGLDNRLSRYRDFSTPLPWKSGFTEPTAPAEPQPFSFKISDTTDLVEIYGDSSKKF